jgi:hypothetical protein
MAEQERFVAVISPWEKLPVLAKRQFRIESLPTEKKVMVWRDDLQTEQALTGELRSVGIASLEVRKKRTTDWKEVE